MSILFMGRTTSYTMEKLSKNPLLIPNPSLGFCNTFDKLEVETKGFATLILAYLLCKSIFSGLASHLRMREESVPIALR